MLGWVGDGRVGEGGRVGGQDRGGEALPGMAHLAGRGGTAMLPFVLVPASVHHRHTQVALSACLHACPLARRLPLLARLQTRVQRRELYRLVMKVKAINETVHRV